MRHILLVIVFIIFNLISVYSQCVISITGAQSVCAGNSITLTANVDRGTPVCNTTLSMNNGNTTVQCGQMVCFFDDGGEGAYYTNSANYTHTFTSSNGGPLTIVFDDARLQASGDSLLLYDGNIATGTLLNAGQEAGVDFAFQTYVATSGVLTVRFVSDASWNYLGWSASITCEACGELTYLWSTGETTPSIRVRPTATTTYTCTVSSTEAGCCSGRATHQLEVIDCGVSGCPHITPTDIDGNSTIYLNCESGLNTTLYANAVVTALDANNYTVARIPYNPPFAFNSGTRIFANATDDTWGPTQQLPFAFCYYGNTYTEITPGSNAVATFNSSYQEGNSCAWSYDASDVLPTSYLFTNTIFACYRDIYPTSSDYNSNNGDGGIFQGVMGEYPCRAYKLSFNNIKLFSCTEITNFSTMIVLYEGTNIIDIYIRNAPTCTTWNDGLGVIGIQNSTGTAAVTPPGRNTGAWTASNEAWRFTPTGSPSYTITWYEGIDTSAASGVVIGNGDQIDVSPNGNTTYTARLQYTACNGNFFDLINSCEVVIDDNTPDIILTASKDTLCPAEAVTITASAEGAISYQWNSGETTPSITKVPTEPHPTYEVTVVFENGCTRSGHIQVHAIASIEPPVFSEVEMICPGERVEISTDEHYTYLWSNGATTQSIIVYPQTTTTYQCTVSNSAGCTSSNEVTVPVDIAPIAAFAPEHYLTYLEDGVATVNFIDFSQNAITWQWDFGVPGDASATSTMQEPSYTYTASGLYTVTQWVRSDLGCTDSTTHQVSIQKPFNFYVPSAFTPNNDGINDIFIPKGEGVNTDDYLLQVFDRNGRLLFQTTSLYQGWDGTDNGKELPLGTYVYVVKTSTMDGTPKEYVGTVTLIQ